MSINQEIDDVKYIKLINNVNMEIFHFNARFMLVVGNKSFNVHQVYRKDMIGHKWKHGIKIDINTQLFYIKDIQLKYDYMIYSIDDTHITLVDQIETKNNLTFFNGKLYVCDNKGNLIIYSPNGEKIESKKFNANQIKDCYITDVIFKLEDVYDYDFNIIRHNEDDDEYYHIWKDYHIFVKEQTIKITNFKDTNWKLSFRKYKDMWGEGTTITNIDMEFHFIKINLHRTNHDIRLYILPITAILF